MRQYALKKDGNVIETNESRFWLAGTALQREGKQLPFHVHSAEMLFIEIANDGYEIVEVREIDG